jgi:hypothetical protein
MAIARGQWISVPFLAMFQFGFLYVVIGSLGKWFNVSSWTLPPSDPPEEPSTDPAMA